MNTLRILKITNFFVWIIFIGLCVITGTLIFTTIISLTLNPAAADNLYLGFGASALLEHSRLSYTLLLSLIIISSGLKATLFYCVIKIISKINIIHPFKIEVAKLIFNISYISLSIGVVSILTDAYINWITQLDIHLSDFNNEFGGSLEFLLLAGIVFVIAQIFKRGIEIQNENELTI